MQKLVCCLILNTPINSKLISTGKTNTLDSKMKNAGESGLEIERHLLLGRKATVILDKNTKVQKVINKDM